MSRIIKPFLNFFFCLALLLIHGCKDQVATIPKEKDIVEKVELLDDQKARNIEQSLRFALQNNGRISDTARLRMDSLLSNVYKENKFRPLWSEDATLLPLADSLISFVEACKEYGLFPSDYHNKALHNLQITLSKDTMAQKNATIWSHADLLLSDAFFLISKHLKQGRLQFDSVTLRVDSILADSYYTNLLGKLQSYRNLKKLFHDQEPRHPGYDSLKSGLKFFLDSVKTFRRLTQVIYPNKDTFALYQQMQKRFFEEDLLLSPTDSVDAATWRSVISAYQKANGLKVTGKVNENTVKKLNNTDWEKFKQIAITLDRYKLLPDTMPVKFIWVNIPSYYMQLVDSNKIVFKSRVVVGKPTTRTPSLTSKITDMITYPQWTIPTSIIVKEVLPGVKKNPEYFAKHGYSIIDREGEEVDPYTVDWNRYTKGIPYKVIQGSGDANALGVLKFNFYNKYSVYMHDTNQRYLFSNASRSLSHGCVRIQDWQKLAHFLIAQDSLNRKPPYTSNFVGSDSLRAWLKRKEKHYLPVRSRLPVFIRYFSSEGVNGKVKFYEDIYGEDKILREKYFTDKSIQ